MTRGRNNVTGRERINDSLRWLIAGWIVILATAFHALSLIRVWAYGLNQRRLRSKYAVSDDTPVRTYDSKTREAIERRFTRMGPTAAMVETSGTTDEPKRIAYDRRRFRRTRWIFIEALFGQLAKIPGNRTLFIFSSIAEDSTLTGRLLAENGLPPYLCGLQAPHRVQNHPAIRALVRTYGETAVRLWIVAIAAPDVFYATNPSTLARFLEDVRGDWTTSRKLVADYVSEPEGLPAALGRIHRRIASRGAAFRLRTIAASPTPLASGHMFPSLRAFCCWDGGYVGSFIDQVREHLPASEYRHLPMYSMSTETVETELVARDGAEHFLPIAPGVLYEFLEEAAMDRPMNLLRPDQLSPGRRYTMVVSDNYGLRRYQTEDIFECVGKVSHLPDLRFRQRRTLSYSFTGEKLTARQLELAYESAMTQFPELAGQVFLTCFPSKRAGEFLPRYRLVMVRTGHTCLRQAADIARCVEQRLSELNPEFSAKVESRRLGTLEPEVLDFAAFVQRVGTKRHGHSWESQFKFLPLYPKLWETLEAS